MEGDGLSHRGRKGKGSLMEGSRSNPGCSNPTVQHTVGTVE